MLNCSYKPFDLDYTNRVVSEWDSFRLTEIPVAARVRHIAMTRAFPYAYSVCSSQKVEIYSLHSRNSASHTHQPRPSYVITGIRGGASCAAFRPNAAADLIAIGDETRGALRIALANKTHERLINEVIEEDEDNEYGNNSNTKKTTIKQRNSMPSSQTSQHLRVIKNAHGGGSAGTNDDDVTQNSGRAESSAVNGNGRVTAIGWLDLGRVVSAGDDGRLCVWDAAVGKRVFESSVVSASASHGCRMMQQDDEEKEDENDARNVETQAGLRAIAVSPLNPNCVIAGALNGTICVFDLRAPITSSSTLSESGGAVMSWRQSGMCAAMRFLPPHHGAVASSALGDDSLATGADSRLLIWSLRMIRQREITSSATATSVASPVATLDHLHCKLVTQLHIANSPQGNERVLFSASLDGIIKITSLTSSSSFVPDNGDLAASSVTSSSYRTAATFQPNPPIQALAVAPCGKFFVLGGANQKAATGVSSSTSAAAAAGGFIKARAFVPPPQRGSNAARAMRQVAKETNLFAAAAGGEGGGVGHPAHIDTILEGAEISQIGRKLPESAAELDPLSGRGLSRRQMRAAKQKLRELKSRLAERALRNAEEEGGRRPRVVVGDTDEGADEGVQMDTQEVEEEENAGRGGEDGKEDATRVVVHRHSAVARGRRGGENASSRGGGGMAKFDVYLKRFAHGAALRNALKPHTMDKSLEAAQYVIRQLQNAKTLRRAVASLPGAGEGEGGGAAPPLMLEFIKRALWKPQFSITGQAMLHLCQKMYPRPALQYKEAIELLEKTVKTWRSFEEVKEMIYHMLDQCDRTNAAASK